MMRRLAAVLAGTVGAWLVNYGVSHADLGNPGIGGSNSPGLCEYPATCGSGMNGAIGAGFYYWEDFPIESNGSHRHCQWGGGGFEGNAQLGFSMMVTASVGAEGPVGAFNGACFYVCPDMQQAQVPNPPGAWKDALVPTKCHPVGVNPFAPPPPPEDVPIAPPIAEQGAVPAVPFVLPPLDPDTFAPFADIPSEPPPPPPLPTPLPPPWTPPWIQPPPPAPFPPDQSGIGPAVTNPVCPNPDATVTKSCGG